MEKNLTLEHNTMALKWTGEVGLYTTLQLVIGMPGEDDDTIFETIEFLKERSPCFCSAGEQPTPSGCDDAYPGRDRKDRSPDRPGHSVSSGGRVHHARRGR